MVQNIRSGACRTMGDGGGTLDASFTGIMILDRTAVHSVAKFHSWMCLSVPMARMRMEPRAIASGAASTARIMPRRRGFSRNRASSGLSGPGRRSNCRTQSSRGAAPPAGFQGRNPLWGLMSSPVDHLGSDCDCAPPATLGADSCQASDPAVLKSQPGSNKPVVFRCIAGRWFSSTSGRQVLENSRESCSTRSVVIDLLHVDR